jgi:hypothetical protein
MFRQRRPVYLDGEPIGCAATKEQLPRSLAKRLIHQYRHPRNVPGIPSDPMPGEFAWFAVVAVTSRVMTSHLDARGNGRSVTKC